MAANDWVTKTPIYTNPLEEHLHELVNKVWNYAGRCETWQDQVMNAVLGLGGEAGEVVDLHKKAFYHMEKDRHEDLVNELGDLFFYATKLMELHGITLEECLAANKAKLIDRHPKKFRGEV